MRHAHLLGAKEPLMHRLVPALVGGNGRGLSRAGPRPAADRGDAAAGGNPLPPDARQRPAPARRGDRAHGRGRHAARRDRVQALRHVRLPLRSDRGRAARPRPERRPRRLRRGDGRAEGRRARRLEGLGRQGVATSCGSTSPRSIGATEFTGYSGDEGEGVVLALVKDGARGRARRRPGETVTDRPQPDALLRRERRPGRRRRKTDLAQGLRGRC